VDASGSGGTIIKQSTLSGSTKSLNRNGGNVKIASTQLVGPLSSGVVCFNNYN
jgi:hypothetical protein